MVGREGVVGGMSDVYFVILNFSVPLEILRQIRKKALVLFENIYAH